jgi:hypothetical protein
MGKAKKVFFHFVVATLFLQVASAGVLQIASAHGADERAAAATSAEQVDLFNGRDLSGWDAVGPAAAADWTVESGCLVCHGKGHNWLRTRKPYDDFNLQLEYQVSPGANSGVYVRVPANGNHHREIASAPPAGFEIQILDDLAPRYAGLKDYQFSASLYDIAGAAPRVSRSAGRWNTLEINCAGPHVTVTHNGVRVVDADSGHYPPLKLRSVKGFLGLQSHNGVVHFRNLRIGPARSTASLSADDGSRAGSGAKSAEKPSTR